MLQVHENTIRNWVKDGVLHDLRVPGTSFIRIGLSEVQALMTERLSAPAPKHRDPEVEAAHLITVIMEKLPVDTRGRLARWLYERYKEDT